MERSTIDGIVILQHFRDAYDVANTLEDAGYEVEIRHEAIDDYSNAAFLSVWRFVDTTPDAPHAHAVVDAVWKEVEGIIAPWFNADLDGFGFAPPGSYAREMAEHDAASEGIAVDFNDRGLWNL
jgi:hypothetical protein